MTRFLAHIALTLVLVVAPFMSTAIAATLQTPSTQSEESHEELQEKDESRVAKRSSPQSPKLRVKIVAERPPVPTVVIKPCVAPPIHPAKYSERRLR